jgi:hypothetical protein
VITAEADTLDRMETNSHDLSLGAKYQEKELAKELSVFRLHNCFKNISPNLDKSRKMGRQNPNLMTQCQPSHLLKWCHGSGLVCLNDGECTGRLMGEEGVLLGMGIDTT